MVPVLDHRPRDSILDTVSGIRRLHLRADGCGNPSWYPVQADEGSVSDDFEHAGEDLRHLISSRDGEKPKCVTVVISLHCMSNLIYRVGIFQSGEVPQILVEVSGTDDSAHYLGVARLG